MLLGVLELPPDCSIILTNIGASALKPASEDEDDDSLNEDDSEVDRAVDISTDSSIYISQGAEVSICSGSMVVLKHNTNIYINAKTVHGIYSYIWEWTVHIPTYPQFCPF